jgi:hypothetical protein
LTDPPKELTDARQFVLRVITRSHPWGYSRRDPTQRLRASERRDAFLEFEALAKATKTWNDNFHPGSLPISLAFPWDAFAPVPVPLFINAMRDADCDIWRRLENGLSALPYWIAAVGQNSRIEFQRQNIKNLLQDPSPYMGCIVRGMRDNLGFGEIATTKFLD